MERLIVILLTISSLLPTPATGRAQAPAPEAPAHIGGLDDVGQLGSSLVRAQAIPLQEVFLCRMKLTLPEYSPTDSIDLAGPPRLMAPLPLRGDWPYCPVRKKGARRSERLIPMPREFLAKLQDRTWVFGSRKCSVHGLPDGLETQRRFQRDLQHEMNLLCTKIARDAGFDNSVGAPDVSLMFKIPMPDGSTHTAPSAAVGTEGMLGTGACEKKFVTEP